MAWRRWTGLVAGALLVVAVGAGCSSSGGGTAEPDPTSPDATTATESGPPPGGTVARPTVQGPVTGGRGAAVLGPGGFDLGTVGYEQEEYFLSGDATSFTADAALLPDDGRWTVRPAATAPYTTRIVVRRPADPSAFDGTVWVEWLNVSGGLDASPDWTYAHNELIRSGAAWVGVSAQTVGINGGGNPLGNILALKNADPERYAALSHPGDDFSYDMYSQAGAAVWFDADTVLGGLEPQRVIAIGESQSAFRLTTYVNAVAPTAQIFDGYLIHSRGAYGAALADGLAVPTPTLVRTDLDVPVLTFSSETDVAGDRLGYAKARQPDTDRFRGWEVAGTAHADAYQLGIGDRDDGSGTGDQELFDAMLDPPTGVYGGAIDCDLPINTGPHTYVLRSAVHALDQWVRTGQAPPSMPRLELAADGALARDERGNARGGIRTPQVDAPVATLSGFGQSGAGFCFLFGTTDPFSASTQSQAYADHADFVARWKDALSAAVDSGAVLAADAEHLGPVAERAQVPTANGSGGPGGLTGNTVSRTVNSVSQNEEPR